MSSFLNALQRTNSAPPPVWMMRQAGRYLPKYRKLRGEHSFLKMMKTPLLAKEVTLLPLETFDLDALILFSDILVIPDAFGLRLDFQDSAGPFFHAPIKSSLDIENLNVERAKNHFNYVFEAISLIKKSSTLPLIGFCGGPFTVASYMLEGGIKEAKQMMLFDPKSFQMLLEKVTKLSSIYLSLQEESGVDAVQIFDTWAGDLPFSLFTKFCLPPLKTLLQNRKTPSILFTKGASRYVEELYQLSPSALSLDPCCSLKKIRNRLGDGIALQGNFDPELLLGPKEFVIEEAKELLASMKNDPAFIFNLGHGILPKTPLENVEALITCVKQSALTLSS